MNRIQFSPQGVLLNDLGIYIPLYSYPPHSQADAGTSEQQYIRNKRRPEATETLCTHFFESARFAQHGYSRLPGHGGYLRP